MQARRASPIPLRFLSSVACLSLVLAELAEASDAPPTDQQRIQAATATANSEPLCTAIQPFYWEIGDADGALVGLTAGGTTPTATTKMDIASASKWMFGAYLVQRRDGQPTAADVKALTMGLGYTSANYSACVKFSQLRQRLETVDDCFHSGGNDTHNAAYDGIFYYGSAQFQAYADQTLALGPDNDAALQRELASQLGDDISFSFDQPLIAAGVKTDAADYAIFLRKILGGALKIEDLLGAYPVCTNPATCPTAAFTITPKSESWHYSLGHWLEDDPNVGDGAFSSPGAYGFYPWIDASRTWYGVLSRYSTADSAFNDSVRCGRLIRKAWETGVAQ